MHQGMTTKRIFIKSTNERSPPILRGERACRVEGRTSAGRAVEPLNYEAIPVSLVHFHEHPGCLLATSTLYLALEYALDNLCQCAYVRVHDEPSNKLVSY